MSGEIIKLERQGDVFTLTMNAGENRWNTTFVRAYAEALNEVEASEARWHWSRLRLAKNSILTA
ncbi:MAG: hypothetical protein CM15mP120_00270 [Pseudomonadota bacterium]|nr:MAG: hypothetical protein CM15mP120_00270 [Pseudomonadota bacterium]